jgi:uncharacterized protein YndB with AHSA1/START domain
LFKPELELPLVAPRFMNAPRENGAPYPMTGTYQEIAAPKRLVFESLALDENDQPLFEVLHTVTFVAELQKTRLTGQARVHTTTTTAGMPHLWGA